MTDSNKNNNEPKPPENILRIIDDDRFSFYLNEISFQQRDDFPNLHVINIKTKSIGTDIDTLILCYVIDLFRLRNLWLEITDRLNQRDAHQVLYTYVTKQVSNKRNVPLAPNVGLSSAHEIKCYQSPHVATSFLLALTLGDFGPTTEAHLFHISQPQLLQVWKSLSTHLQLKV